MPRYIFHVDLDAFYASVEQRENPALLGKPLIIGADPKDGKGRGVRGQPISIAYRLMPEATYMRPIFETYYDKSSEKKCHF